jgi:hypothetical protein
MKLLLNSKSVILNPMITRKFFAAVLLFLCTLSCTAQDRGPWDPIQYGADPSGILDSTSAIQKVLNAAGSLMGGIVLVRPGTYLISSCLTVPNGVRFQGSGAFFTYGGTIIKNTGSGPAICLNATSGGGTHSSGRFVEVSNMMIQGNGSTDDGIDITGSSTISPQGYKISNVQLSNFGGEGIKITGTSYGTIEKASMNGTGTSPVCFDVEGGSLYTEVSYFDQVSEEGCVIGTRVLAGNNLYFNHFDLNANQTGLYISGSTFNLFFDNTNIVYPTQNGIEIAAMTNFIGRIQFRNTTIDMLGASASETAIYAHRNASYTIFDTDFYMTDIENGTTPPTDAIVTDGGSCISFEQLRNVPGTSSIGSLCPFNVTGYFQINGYNVPVASSTQTTGALVCIKSGGSTGVFGGSPPVYGTCTAISGATCTICQ